jgi:Txe/YoeB family toxin of Txe-Axe toxin-antitoxin module
MERRFSGFGQSKIEATWNTIRRLSTVESSIESAVSRVASLVLKIQGLEDVDDIKEGRKKVANRISKLIKHISNNRATAISQQEELEWISPDLSNYTEVWQTLASAAARAARMPKTKLFGDSPAGLSESDQNAIENWNKRIREIQETQILPALVLLYRAEYGSLDGWTFQFNPLNEESELEKAEKRLKIAKQDQIYLQMGVRKKDQVARSRDGVDGWSMDTETREDLKPNDAGKSSTRRESIIDKLAKIQGSETSHLDQQQIPKGPYGSPPTELRKFLMDSGVDNAIQQSFEYVKIYNEVFNFTGTHSKAREASMQTIVFLEGNPFSGADDDDLPEYVQEMPEDKREKWVAVWEDVFDDTDSESQAFKAANAAVKGDNGDSD